MDSAFFIHNRQRLAERICDKSALILFSGAPARVSTHEKYDFRPNKHFYYMTGITEPNCYYALFKSGNLLEEWLFIEEPDVVKASWNGEMLSESEASSLSGIVNVGFLSEFEAIVEPCFHSCKPDALYLNVHDHPKDDRHRLKALFENRMPLFENKDIYADLCSLRMIKQKEEAAEIRHAIVALYEGLQAMMVKVRSGMMEYELEAFHDFALRSRGLKRNSFKTILASGHRATILHYLDNNARIEPGNLILADFDVEYGQYHCDITRVFPANGKFTDRQRQLYELVLDVQREIIAKINPGMTFGELNDLARIRLAEKCQAIALIDSPEQLSAYYFHQIGHHLGLDTHDVGDQSMETVIQAGMVLTVEPGLYIPAEAIGIRIEDNVYVRESGCEVLSGNVMKTVEEIEAFMAANNIAVKEQAKDVRDNGCTR
jgi:Xaa-Pro aminopeptidase